jgi:hypothetical protein
MIFCLSAPKIQIEELAEHEMHVNDAECNPMWLSTSKLPICRTSRAVNLWRDGLGNEIVEIREGVFVSETMAASAGRNLL